jgi:hypothetical protein
MKISTIIVLSAFPFFARSQTGLIGKWKGRYPSSIAQVKGDTQKRLTPADSVIVFYVFRRNLTGYVQTIDYTSGTNEKRFANFRYKVSDDKYISMTFLKPSRQQTIKKRKFFLNADTLYFIPTKKEAYAESIELMYEMKYKRIHYP